MRNNGIVSVMQREEPDQRTILREDTQMIEDSYEIPAGLKFRFMKKITKQGVTIALQGETVITSNAFGYVLKAIRLLSL